MGQRVDRAVTVDNGGMVAIIRCGPDEEDHIGFYRRIRGASFPEWIWTTNRLRRLWPSGAHLALIVTGSHRGDPQVTMLGWIRRVRRVDDLNQKLEISRIYAVDPPLAESELLKAVPDRYSQHLREEGQQPAGTGKALLAAMFGLRPDWRSVANTIEAVAGVRLIGSSTAAQVLAHQRDASIGISRMAGFDVAEFASWSPPPDPSSDNSVPPTFLSGVAGEQAHEDQLINQDMRTMLGQISDATGHVNWRLFTSGDRQLFVVNANREPAENVLGVDLIYYNVNRESLVLVQYKKLDASQNGRYYPAADASLDSELRRMRTLDRYVALRSRDEDDFRLLTSPSWIKLCHPLPYVPTSADMIHGMYLARRHFEQLRTSERLKGSRGGVSFSYRTVPNYLDNTMFTRLVETGMIGTAGTSTELVHQQIIRSFTAGKALALGVLAGDDLPQSERNSLRRSRR